MTWLTVTEYLSQMWWICRYENPVLFSFMTYHPVCNKQNTTGATSRSGIAYPSGASIALCGVRVAPSLVFCVVFCRSLSVLLPLFCFVIALSVLLPLFCFVIVLSVLLPLFCFVIALSVLPLFCFVIVLSVRFTASDYCFDIFKLLKHIYQTT